MNIKKLATRTVKLGITAFVYVTIVTWLCNLLSKVFAPVTELVKDLFNELFPESEATKEKRQKLTQDYFRLMGQQCLCCGMYVPVQDPQCECCGEMFLERFPEEFKAGFNKEQEKKLEVIKRKRGII